MDDVDTAITNIEAGIKSIYENRTRTGRKYGAMGTGHERFKEFSVIPTGMDFLDSVVKGLRQSQLIILGARTSVGKSSFALNIAMNVSVNHKVLLFSLEMDQEEIELRMIGITSRINTDLIDAGALDDAQRERFKHAEADLLKRKMIIYDDVYSLSDIRSIVKKEHYSGGVGLVVVDYLQLVETDIKADRHLQVAEISRTLKRLAKECKTPVMALSQMNRVAAGEEPQLHHLRESGSIEQDANMVVFLYDPKDGIHPEMMKCIIAKNRRSRTGAVDMLFEKKYQTFRGL
jgi:replicative DNA helicase